ncbi:MAG: polysaccharide deacetylase family protein [Syntrophobacteraceae bacterium]
MSLMRFYPADIVFNLCLVVLLFCTPAAAAQRGDSSLEPVAASEEYRTNKGLPEGRASGKTAAMPSARAATFPARLRPSVIGSELPPEMRYSIRSVKVTGGQKIVALTFDLCERERSVSGYDGEVVNFLRANKIKATFFASGKWMRSHPEKTMQLMSDPLFEIGNHGWSHRNFRLLDRKRTEEEILWTQAQYELLWEEVQKSPLVHSARNNSMEAIPRVPMLFRFPFGTCNPEALGFLQSIGLAAIQWDVVSGDAAKGQTAPAIAGIVMKQARTGSIIIFHANGRGHGTAESLPIFVPKLQESGFTFVTVSELLSSGTPVVASDCYELRPGDNLWYDKIFGK